MESKDYIDKVIKFLTTEEGLYYVESSIFLKETVTNEYYVLFYYIEELNKSNLVLTKEFLQTGMEVNKMDWVNERSVFMRDNPTITKEYLQSMTKVRLEYDIDYANALEEIVLARFSKIESIDTPEEKEFLGIISKLKDIASIVFAKKVSLEVQPLIMGEKEYLYHNKLRYGREDALQYMVNRSQQLNFSLSANSNHTNNKYNVWEKTSRVTSGIVPTYIWNLGKNIFSNPQPGHVVSLIAPSKVGKTRFAVGEIAYPSILLGRNVKYYSGEMEEHILRSMLLTKHIKYTKGYKIKESTVEKVFITASRIRTKKATASELLYFDKVPSNIKETIFQAEHDLFFSGKYGNIGVAYVGDINKLDNDETPGEFVVERQHDLLRKENERLPSDDKWDVVIQDHVNHMRSEKGLKDAAMIESYIQSAKAYASSEDTKCVYVIVNHLNTNQENKIREQDSAEGMNLRGHGSNESGKSADMEYVMYQTSLDRKEGTVHLQVTVDRYKNISEVYKTDTFVLVADRANCDFTFDGVGVKKPYPTVDQLKKIEEVMMENH